MHRILKGFKGTIKSRIALILSIAIITFLGTEIAAKHPDVVEQYYSQGIYPYIAKGLSLLSSQVSFSIDDCFYALLAIWLIALPFLVVLKRISIKMSLLLFVGTLAAVYTAFYLLWGFNYYRNDIEKRLNLHEVRTDGTELMYVFAHLIDECNRNYSSLDRNEYDLYGQLIEAEYYSQADFLRIDKDLCSTRPKSITLSRFFAAATIGGYYGPFFSEAHVNKYLLPFEYPAILAHELAHRYGITSESEANFYAWYICSHSKDERLRYSAYFHLLRYFLPHVYHLEGAKEALEKLRPEVKEDYRKQRAHWRVLMNKDIENAAHKLNDAYLKTNKVEGGISDYEGVVKYVIAYYNTAGL